LIAGYNIDFRGGPPIHYLIADRTGHAAVVEYKDGSMQVVRNEDPWLAATNFYLAGNLDSEAGAGGAALDHAHRRIDKQRYMVERRTRLSHRHWQINRTATRCDSPEPSIHSETRTA
jgi:hypothetical protein